MDETSEVEIRRSTRRRRTVSARREGGRTIILMPAGLPAGEEQDLVDKMLAKLARADRRSPAAGDEELMARALRVSQRWLDGEARPASVRWVPEMRTRWGSCTPADGTIRISSAVAAFPDYVQDYLLVHELAHLVVPDGHTPAFWALVRRYPRTERAIGYLEASSRGGPGEEDCAG